LRRQQRVILRRHRLRPAAILALAAGVLARVAPCEAAAGQLESYRYEAIPLGEAGAAGTRASPWKS